jgi:hypothetical protein
MYESDCTRDNYPVHHAVADALGGTVRPFDQYQGPYVVVGPDVRAGSEPYAVAPRGLGVVRLWLCDDGEGRVTVFNEATERESDPFIWDDENGAIEAARSVV